MCFLYTVVYSQVHLQEERRQHTDKVDTMDGVRIERIIYEPTYLERQ
jgi:hypothetical protein